MKIELKNNKFKSALFNFNLPFGFSFRAIFNLYHTPNEKTLGQYSLCFDGYHVLFFDYDSFDLDMLIKEIKERQEIFDLPTAYIFETDENSFHVIILSKHTLQQAYEIISSTNTDYAFQNAPKFFKSYGREWILRCVEKGERDAPKYLMCIERKSDRIISTQHKRFLEKWFKLPKILGFNEDKYLNNKFPICEYTTGNRTKC